MTKAELVKLGFNKISINDSDDIVERDNIKVLYEDMVSICCRVIKVALAVAADLKQQDEIGDEVQALKEAEENMTPEEIAQAREMFDRYDADGSGAITND